MANGASSHSFKIDLDVSNVISGLKAVDATAENITKKLNQALIVPQSLPAGVTAKDVGRAAGDTTRGAVTAFQQRTGINDPAVLKEFRNNFAKALRDAYEPLLKELAAKSGTSKGVQGKDYSSGFKSSFNDTDFNSFLKTLNPAVVKGVVAPPKSDSEKSAERASKKAAETIINLQRKLGDDLGDYDKLVAMSANEQEKLLRQLEQRRYVQKSQRGAEDKALASLDARERVRAGDPDQLLARGAAASRANYYQIEGEAALLTRTNLDNGDSAAVVVGKKEIAHLNQLEALELRKLIESDKDISELSAQEKVVRRKIKLALDQRIRELEGVSDPAVLRANKGLADFAKDQQAERDRQEADRQRRLLNANQGVTKLSQKEQDKRDRREAARLRQEEADSRRVLSANKGISGFVEGQRKQEAALAKRRAEQEDASYAQVARDAESERERKKRLDRDYERAIAERKAQDPTYGSDAVDPARLQREIEQSRAQADARNAAQAKEDAKAEQDRLTQREIARKRSENEAFLQSYKPGQAVTKEQTALLDPLQKKAESDRQKLIQQIGAREKELLGKRVSTYQELNALDTQTLTLRRGILGRTNAEQAKADAAARRLTEGIQKAAEAAARQAATLAKQADSLAAEVGPQRAALIRTITAREEALGGVTRGDIEDLKKKSTADLTTISNGLPLTPAEIKRNKDRADREAKRLANEANRNAKQAERDDVVNYAAKTRKGRLIGQVGAAEEKLGIPLTDTASLSTQSNSQLRKLIQSLEKRVRAEDAATRDVVAETAARNRVNSTRAVTGLETKISALQGKTVASLTSTADLAKLTDIELENYLSGLRDQYKALKSPPKPPKPPKPVLTTQEEAIKALDAERKAREIELLKQKGTTPQDIGDAAAVTIGRERIARQKELAVLEGRTASDYRAMGNLHAQRLSAQNQLKTAEFRELRTNEEFLRARAERIIEERKYNHEQRKVNAQVAREQGFGGSSVLARFLGKFGSGNPGGGGSGSAGGGIPPTLTEFFGHGAANIARYAIPGSLAFGALSGIKNTIKEAEELDRVFATIEAQFDSTFGEGAKPKFEAFKKEILTIARETGVAGEDVANVAFQLQGAFGTGTGVRIDGASGTRLVADQIRAAAEISKVTGLSSKEITDSLTAASIGFGESFRTIGDVTISLQDRFGVLAKEIIPFLGDIAPVAEEAGFSLAEFATIAAVTQQKSGKAGSALAEAYGRVIPQITKSRSELLKVGQTDSLSADFNDAVANGTTRDVFFAVANQFESMSKNSQEFVINLLGGRREAQSILAAFSNSATLLKAIEDTGKSGGTLGDRFQRISETVSESLARLQEKFRQLGVAIYEGGLGEALNQTISLLSLLVGVLDKVFDLAGSVNETFGGMPAKILAAYAAFKLLSSVGASLTFGGLTGAAGTGVNSIIARNAAAAAARPAANPLASGFVGATVLTTGQLAALGGTQFGTAVGANRPDLNRTFKQGAKVGIDKFGKAVSVAGSIGATLVAGSLISYLGQMQAEVDQQKEVMKTQTLTELNNALLKAQAQDKDLGKASFDFSNPLDELKKGLKFDVGFFKTGSIQGAKDYVTGRKDIEDAIRNRKFADSGTSELVSTAFQDPEDLKKILGESIPNQTNIKDALASQLSVALGKRDKVSTKPKDVQKDLNDPQIKQILDNLAKGDLDQLDELLTLAVNNPAYQNVVNTLLGFLQTSPDKDIVERAKRTIQDSKDKIKAQKITRPSAVNLDSTKSAFDLGIVGIDPLLNAYDEAIKKAESARSLFIDKTSDAYKEADLYLGKLQKDRNSLYSKTRSSFTSFQSELSQLETGDTDASKLEEVTKIAKDLEDPKFTDPDERIAAARKAINLLQSLDKTQKIPEAVRKAFAEFSFSEQQNPEFSDLAELIRSTAGVGGDALVANVQQTLVNIALGQGSIEEIKAAIQNKIEVLASVAGALGFLGVDQELDNYQRILDIIYKLSKEAVAVPKEAKPKSGKDTANDILNAKQDYYKSLIEGDPVKLARLAVQQADEDFAAAGGDEAKQYQAMAARVRALRQLRSAEFDVETSRGELASAMAAYRGDTLKVAQLAVDDAIKQRDEVYRLFETGGAGEADKNRAEVALIQAKANARDAQLASQKDDYQFLYDMGQITKSQFIQYLQTLKQIPDLTTEQIRSLDREIKQLQGELNQDLQFNLPTKFKLPTLYETRRIGQTGSSQAAYVDNRNVNIVLNVSDGSSQQQMMQVLTDVIGGGARITGTKRY